MFLLAMTFQLVETSGCEVLLYSNFPINTHTTASIIIVNETLTDARSTRGLYFGAKYEFPCLEGKRVKNLFQKYKSSTTTGVIQCRQCSTSLAALLDVFVGTVRRLPVTSEQGRWIAALRDGI